MPPSGIVLLMYFQKNRKRFSSKSLEACQAGLIKLIKSFDLIMVHYAIFLAYYHFEESAGFNES